MHLSFPRPVVLRFGVFEVDLQSEELRKSGLRVKLPGQSFQILRMLLERPGELVAREDLRQVLWPGNTYVDFDHGLNAAVTRLRDALGDSADTPRFVETLPRRGYRFIGTLQPVNGASHQTIAFPETPARPMLVKFPAREGDWRWLAAGVVVLILTVGAGLLLLHHPTRVANLTVVPFTSLPGLEVNPSFSPDGTRIVFAWDGEPPEGRKGFDLYVKEIGSEHLLRLTNTGADWLVPSWSPDGRSIVFTRAARGSSGIYSISALGGDERLIKKDNGEYNSLDMSADGRYLAYPETVRQTGLYRVALLDMQTMLPVPLQLPNCLVSSSPAFAPVGHRLAFACTSSWGIIDLYVIPEINAVARKVTRIFGFPTGIAWTRDDRSLIVGVERGRSALWRVNVATGRSEPLLLDSQAVSPAIAPRGDRLAFAQKNETGNIWRVDLKTPSSPAQRLIPSTRMEQNPRYSPDGKHIVFESARSGFSEIWTSLADGSDVQQLTHFQGPLTGSPRWAPDSRHIVFDSRDSGQSNLYIMDINQRVPRRVPTNVPDVSTPSYSHDGQWIYFRSDGADRPGVYKVPATGGKAAMLAEGDGYSPEESLDGKELFYSSGYKRNVIRRLSLVTGEDSAVTTVPALGHLVSWTLASHGMYFLQQTELGYAAVYFYNNADGLIRRVVELPLDDKPTPVTGGLSLSPDERFLLYSQLDEQQSDIMLVENFQ